MISLGELFHEDKAFLDENTANDDAVTIMLLSHLSGVDHSHDMFRVI